MQFGKNGVRWFFKNSMINMIKTLGDRINIFEKAVSKDYSKNFMSQVQVFLETNFIETYLV